MKEQPTEKDLKECRHVKNGLSRNVWFVAVLGLCERFAYYGIIVMFRTWTLPRMLVYSQFMSSGDLKKKSFECSKRNVEKSEGIAGW